VREMRAMKPQAGGEIEPDHLRPDAPPDALPQHVRGVYQSLEPRATSRRAPPGTAAPEGGRAAGRRVLASGP